MNQNNRFLELSIDRLALNLESLEEYIRHAGYYSDWISREQFFRRTIGGSNRWDLEHDEDHFFSNLSISQPWFKDEPENIRKKTQKEFYKWINYSGITVENCPENLKHYLNQINEVLEGRGESLVKAYREEREKWFKMFEERNSVFWQAAKEVQKFFFGEPVPTESGKKICEVKIKGNSEQGQETWQQIKNSITSQPEWTFPWKRKYYRKLKEKIKELEEKKDYPQPKEERKREENLENFDEYTLMSLELYIQKLDCYPNWKIREWTEKDREDWRKNWENKTIKEIKELLLIDLRGTSLMLKQFKAGDPNYYPILLSELKNEFSQWQKEKGINSNNCPEHLKQVLWEISELLEDRSGNIWKKNDKDKEEIEKVFIDLKLEVIGLLKKNKFKNKDLGSEFSNWENKMREIDNVSKMKSYQRQIKAKIQLLTTYNENESSWPTKKIVVGVGITGVIIGVMFITYQVIKNKKVKK